MASSYAAVNRRALCGFHHHHFHHNLTTGVMAYGISSLGAMMVIMMIRITRTTAIINVRYRYCKKKPIRIVMI